ncbi:hypothetical protein V496_07823 [Pseudogymnoascus sp. VKM F-4515 (FW-2607)]|nr:hypothetical protein V496_07823 [Pseudogymnoascus sp. VKM F-4515 (FW-2607)]
MSARSDPSATTTNGGSNASKKSKGNVTLSKYLATPPTIIEELAFSGSLKAEKKIVADRKKKAADYISNWEASWEKMG